ncbi:MAG TPA: universal stress protein [Nitrososphaerales archaeon]|nr:universal stress protein [Nitrososphaerales archaeon]
MTQHIEEAIKTQLPKTILVAVEGSEPSLREASLKAAGYALELAAVAKADLVAACVVQIPEYIDENTRASLRKELFDKSERTLEEVQQLAANAAVNFRPRILETGGSIATSLCGLADAERVDLIVLGTRANASPLTKMMLGSVASGVASNASCPVLVVR